VNGRRGEDGLAVLIERSAELKRDLVDFACSPRLERSLAAALLEAGLEEIEEADAIGDSACLRVLLCRTGSAYALVMSEEILGCAVAGCTVRLEAKGDPGGDRWPLRRV
jgi:hypothetical protein